MADNAPPPQKEYDAIDPFGIELVLSLLSTAATVISTAFQFGRFIPKHPPIHDEIKKLREQGFRLQNGVDELALIVLKHGQQLTEREPSLSGTQFDSSPADYVRWIDLRDKMHEVSKGTYDLVSKIRESCLEANRDEEIMSLDTDVLRPFDNLVINFGNYNFGQLIAELRETLKGMDSVLLSIINPSENER